MLGATLPLTHAHARARNRNHDLEQEHDDDHDHDFEMAHFALVATIACVRYMSRLFL